MRLLAFDLTLSPRAQITWAEDVYGNAVATATFGAPAQDLFIESVAKVELRADPWPVFPIAAEAISFPYSYRPDDRRELGALFEPTYGQEAAEVAIWAERFVAGRPTDTLSLLGEAGVGGALVYEARESEGAQTPLETLRLKRGSCRDFAVLFVESVRALGFAARIVSGYLHDSELNLIGSADAGSTHAWAEVFVPGAGWIVYDPTNKKTGGFNLIPVAVAQTIARAMPVVGAFTGPAEALIERSVAVSVL